MGIREKANTCLAGSSANNLHWVNFEYMCGVHVLAHFAFQHATARVLMHHGDTASYRDFASQRHNAVSKSILNEGMLVAYPCIIVIDVAIHNQSHYLHASCFILPPGRSQHQLYISHLSCKAPCVLRMP